MAWLLDVNCLIALLDPNHVHHESAHQWFARREPRAWATCPLTENGLVRVLAQPAYSGGPYPPATTIRLLRDWKANYSDTHEMWADDVSLSDAALFRAEYIVSPKQVADVYLLGLAFHRGGHLVSYDLRLPWEAVEGATSALVHHPDTSTSAAALQ